VIGEGCSLRRLLLTVAAWLLVAGAVTAPSAGARTSVDPCGTLEGPALTHWRDHCGRVFEIPAHRTWQPRERDLPPDCSANVGQVAGLRHLGSGIGLGGDWDYWTQNGEWIVWTGLVEAIKGNHGQPINVSPFFHNYGSRPWAVRVFFDCEAVPR
jgi:hypothetical protein